MVYTPEWRGVKSFFRCCAKKVETRVKHLLDGLLQKFFEDTSVAAMLITATQGKTKNTNDVDVDSNSVEFGLDVDEEALIAEETEFEKKFILKH